MIIRIDVDGSRGYENEGWIDIDGEFDVAVFISVEFEFSLLLIVIESFIIFLLFILHFLFDDFIDLAHPLETTE